MAEVDSNMFRQIGAAQSPAALWALMVRYFRERGFEAMAYILFDRANHSQTVAMLEYGFPPEMLTTYAALGQGRHDAMLRVAMATGRPTRRADVARTQRLSREETWHRNVMQGLGVREVLALPLYGPHGRDAMAVLANPQDPALLEPTEMTELHMMAHAAHLRAVTLRPTQPVEGHGLSDREMEILRWVAQGKSNAVIAEILELSPGTVDTYMRRVFDKLDVADRTSAAVKGVSMGLIRA